MKTEVNTNQKGITLIALIIAIIILIILAMVAIHAVYEFKIVDYAVNGAGDYAKESKRENEIMDQTASDMRAIINKKPVFTKTELEEKTDTSIKVIACATDGDKDKLVYTLYVGTTKDNLELKKTSDEIEQGIDVTLTTTITTNDKYYRVDVTDGVATIKGKVNALAVIEVGSYVDYKPQTGTFNITGIEPSTGVAYSELVGNSYNTSDFTTEEFPWRIWNIDEENNKLVLIADGVTSTGGYNSDGRLYLERAQGYNNSVKTLNDLCKTCYSNSSIGATGRSFNIADIEEKLKAKPTYTKTITCLNGYNGYPLIYMYEEYSNIDENIISKGEQLNSGVQALTKNEQNKYFTPTENEATNGYKYPITSIKPTETSVSLSLTPSEFGNSKYLYLTTKKGDSNTNLNSYFLSSRCIFHDEGANFAIQFVNNSSLSSARLFNSYYRGAMYVINAVRPMVEIPLNSIILGDDYGAGTEDDPLSITKI